MNVPKLPQRMQRSISPYPLSKYLQRHFDGNYALYFYWMRLSVRSSFRRSTNDPSSDPKFILGALSTTITFRINSFPLNVSPVKFLFLYFMSSNNVLNVLHPNFNFTFQPLFSKFSIMMNQQTTSCFPFFVILMFYH